MILVGLTGGIASGKSTVSSIFRDEFDCPVVDADLIARQVVEPGEKAYKRIVDCFGEQILLRDGQIDRAKLGETVFKDERKRKLLNSITHPEIGKAMMWAIVKKFFLGHRFLILDVPLLFESKTYVRITSFNVVVSCEPDTQLRRLMTRNDLPEEEAKRRIEAQMPLSEKTKLATHVIDNEGSLEQTFLQVEKIFQELNHSRRYLIVRFVVSCLLLLFLLLLYWTIRNILPL